MRKIMRYKNRKQEQIYRNFVIGELKKKKVKILIYKTKTVCRFLCVRSLMIQETIIIKRPKIETSWKYDQIITMKITTRTEATYI